MKTTCCNAHRSWWSITASLLLWAAVAMAHAGTVTYVYTDPQGTPLAEADAQGNITARFDYSPYGSIALGTAPNGPGYTGHVNDSETGLVYMQARYYDPVTGRFLSKDPVGPSPGSLFNFNRYAYADNNPIVNTDPTGACVGSHDGQDAPCNPPQSSQSTPPPPPPSPPPLPKTVKTLAAVTVTATAEPIAWGEIGGGTIRTVEGLTAGMSAPAIVVGALWPTTMGAAPCEMPGGPRCGMMMSGAFPPGFWPGDTGAAEWGRRHGVGSKEGKDRFHRGVKEHTPGARGDHDFGVNPETGEVVDQTGDPVGNLNDEQ